MTTSARVLCMLGASCVVFGAGYALGTRTAPSAETLQHIDLSEINSSYTFINPLLFCQDQNLSNQSANTIEKIVSDYIDKSKQDGTVTDAAFYFRDLNGGPWALVNGDFKSIPSSLLKVPVAISAYAHAEKNPGFLDTKVPYKTATGSDSGEFFQPADKIKIGSSYTVTELIRYMVAFSDNEALFLLGSLMDPSELSDSYTHLGIETPMTGDRTAFTVSVKTYASFFRILYNGTYLSRDNSEKLLATLSESQFNQGLSAGIPRNIVVAHKFGEASSPDGTKQLHDCGIVYKPRQPYLICVMTKGTDFSALSGVISHISETVYDSLKD